MKGGLVLGAIRDITDAIRKALQLAASAGDKLDKTSRKSFAKGASEQTFHFPHLIANSASVNTATTLNRNLDVLNASFVQIYLSANGIIDLNYIKNPKQFIAQYQTNFSMESADDMDEESLLLESFMEDYKMFYEGANALYVDDDVNHAVIFTEGAITPGIMKSFREGNKEFDAIYNTNPVMYCEMSNQDKADMIDEYLKDKSDEKSREEMLDGTSKLKSPELTNKDIKKMNDMQPYVLSLKLLATKGDSSLSQYINFDVGVKTTSHLGDSDVIIKNIVYVLKNKSPMFNFIRWTTGELSLIKDIILNVNDINFNVANRYNPTGKFISTLKHLKEKKFKVTTSGMSKVVPFAALTITSYEYNILKNQYGFDLKNVTFAKKVMNELFLMHFIIIDEGTQTIDMLVDGYNDFHQYSLELLEKEAMTNSSKLSKELLRMVGN